MFRTSTAALLIVWLFPALSVAQATRTWVSGLGDDANPCSRTAPCLTFAGAFPKTATKGEIDALDMGDFGPVTLTKAITLDGHQMSGRIVATTGADGIEINAGPSDVVILRNLVISGDGVGRHGIRFIAGRALHVENCIVTGFTGNGIHFSPVNSGTFTLQDTVARNNAMAGIHVEPAAGIAKGLVARSSLSGNADGLLAGPNARVTLLSVVATGNTGRGFAAVGGTLGTAEIQVERSVSTFNAVGVSAGGSQSATVRLAQTTVLNNDQPVDAQESGIILSNGNNQILPNVTLNTDRLASNVILSASELTPTLGTAVTLTATLNADPGGVVSFKEGTAILGTATVSGGTATLNEVQLPAGVHALTATYPGGELFAPSTSGELQIEVKTVEATTHEKVAKGCATAAGPLALPTIVFGFLISARWNRARQRQRPGS
jgi:hypothetical protein